MIRKALPAIIGLAVMVILMGYLNDSDTPTLSTQPEKPTSLTTTTQETSEPQDLSTEQLKDKPLEKHTSTNNDLQTGSGEDDETSSALISEVMSEFENMEEILENIDHPSVLAMIEAMPPASQKTMKMAALKHSVSKRLDQIEANPLSTVDLPKLNQDIDTLAQNLVMMPEEARTLKAYLRRSSERPSERSSKQSSQ